MDRIEEIKIRMKNENEEFDRIHSENIRIFKETQELIDFFKKYCDVLERKGNV